MSGPMNPSNWFFILMALLFCAFIATFKMTSSKAQASHSVLTSTLSSR